jgi:hypothetical protein
MHCGDRRGCHSSLGCVICQKSHLCFVMYCGDRPGCHSSLGCVICKKNHIRASYVNWRLCGFSSMCRQWHWWHAVTTRLRMTKYSNSCHHVDDMAPSVMRELHRITKPYNVTSSNQQRLVWTGGGTNPFNKIRRWKYSTFSVNGVINLTCVCTLVYLHHTVVLAQTCDPGEAVT